MFLGLRTVIYPAPDLDAAKAWFTRVLGIEPYFDEPFYVGFDVGGYELGLNPNADLETGPVTYWGVPDIDVALAPLLEAGAKVHEPIAEPGDGIRVATVIDPFGSPIGLIENPIFALNPVEAGDGPGR